MHSTEGQVFRRCRENPDGSYSWRRPDFDSCADKEYQEIKKKVGTHTLLNILDDDDDDDNHKDDDNNNSDSDTDDVDDKDSFLKVLYTNVYTKVTKTLNPLKLYLTNRTADMMM